jgi:hypothetical protein
MYSTHETIELLLSKYYEFFEHIDIDRIDFIEYERENNEGYTLKGINDPDIRNLLDEEGVLTRYVLKSNLTNTELLTPEQQQWSLFEVLASIDEECDGVIKQPNFHSFSVVVDMLSTKGMQSDYMTYPDLPPLIETDIV